MKQCRLQQVIHFAVVKLWKNYENGFFTHMHIKLLSRIWIRYMW